jgi:hypothetical protein
MPADVETILAHPALTGRTLLIRRGQGWSACDIQSGGRLGDCRPYEGDPTSAIWRGGQIR